MSLKKLYDYRKSTKSTRTNTVPFIVPRLLNHTKQNLPTGNSTLHPLPHSTLPPLPPSSRQIYSSSRWSSEPHMINSDQLTNSVDSPDRIKSSTDSVVFGINPCLYEEEDEVDVETNFEKGNIGRLWFSVQYNPEAERLMVNLVQIKNLPSRSPPNNNACDPFVKVGLFPVERRNLQSSVKKKTCCPKFEENFVFQVPLKDLRQRCIKFTVYDGNRGKHNVIIGYVIYPLKLYESYSRVMLWRDLQNDESSAQAIQGMSQLYISLSYNTELSSLTVGVYAGKDFKAHDDARKKTELYLVVSLAHVHHLLKSKRSAKIRHSTDPLFNEMFKLKLPQKDLNTVSLSVSVFIRKPSSKDQVLGIVVLGSFMFARGSELEHWTEMVTREKEQTGRWHNLL